MKIYPRNQVYEIINKEWVEPGREDNKYAKKVSVDLIMMVICGVCEVPNNK